ncbi:MAG TPA: Pr6Pr family membrane protein [Chitinophagaceae bacterium]|nr:Pr6Pr family membrane protein [Chitinophagaceae bacterium]
MPQSSSRQIFLFVITITGWFALIAQLYLIILNRVTTVPGTIIRYFSFFTILTNILVALCCTVLLINKNKRWYKFFSNSKTITAITVYITVVGLVYNLILRFLWRPQGLQLLVDELLHSVILFFLFCFGFFLSRRQN